ncbi:hypothetical protein [Microbacterium sp. T32]|uniref:hypothetical protein n=1 Tax=Microbacterium sp. T32 TaxID=1776083 RepID=UPI000B32D99D|nr:hypothetical protein [Microbacterium sp. T32]
MSRRPSIVVRVFVGVFLVVSVAGASAPATAADSHDDGTPLSVTITDGSTPTPSVSTSGPASGAGGSGGGSGSSSGGSVRGGTGGGSVSGGSGAGGPAGSAGGGTTTPTNEVSLAGMLYVGGLNGTTTPLFNPADGTVELWFTVRNASTSVIDASARFWIDGTVFSNDLDAVNDVPIAGLQPGETRVVSASLHNAGQWTLISGHVTLTPPDAVDGTALTPVTRDGLFLLFPWLIVVLLIVAVLAWVIVRVVREALPPVPAAVTT